ncbi:MAG: hypothetical protein ACLUVY_04195 [Bacteroides uniformis]
MKKKKSEMSGLVLLLFSTLTLICGTTTSVKAQSSDNKKRDWSIENFRKRG